MKRFKVKLVVLLALMSLFSFSLNVQAQSGAPALAAVQNGHIVIISANPPITVNNPPNKGFQSLMWNPGATKLAYILIDDQFQSQIAVTDVNGSEPIVLNTGRLESGFPVNWTPDGQVLFMGSGNFTDTSKPYSSNIMRIAPEAGATAEIIGSFEMGIGCGGGSPFPADGAYWQESGFGGTPLILQWTDYGILHSTNCGGGGMALYAPQGGQDTMVVDDSFLQTTEAQPQQAVGRAVLELDGKTLAAVRSTYNDAGPITSLVLIDLSTRTVTDMTTDGSPEQLAWGTDGSLFYSTRTQTGDLTTGLSAEQSQNLQSVLGGMDIAVPTYEVTIHRLNITSGEDKVIHTAPAYAVGRMAVTANGQALVFSQVANMDQWVEGIANVTFDVADDSDGSAQRATVPVTVYWLPLDASTGATSLGDDLAQFRLKP